MQAYPVAGILAATACLLCGASTGQDHSSDLGLFEGQSDIGSVVPPGTGSYDPEKRTYTLTAAGANTWYRVDHFHYVWKKAVGDLALTADISFPPHTYGHEPNPHRKGLLMFRQTLDPGGIYVDVAVHGSGLTALQYRRERGANTQDIEINTDAVRTVRLEKRGDVFTLYGSRNGEPLHPLGASIKLHLKEPFYVGLGALSHDVDTTDKVEFAHVTLQPPAPARDTQLHSTLQTISIQDQFRRAIVIRTVPGRIQSPNWAPDRKSIYVHEDGRVRKIPYLTPDAGGAPEDVAVGKLVGCSGNFGLSPDGKYLAVSCAETKGGHHEVYVLPAGGGDKPRKLTHGASGSFFHAWAPDSQAIAFTRGSAGKADIFTIPLAGGAETRLTSDTVNDGPDYTPDGKLIYFDSSRSGSTQIWRMKPDGTAAEQVTDDGHLNTSPHVSPDGKSVAFLSQPANSDQGITDATLKVMSLADGMIRPIVDFQGNRDSFSMYGWGDATHLAFVSYQPLPAPGNAPAAGAAQLNLFDPDGTRVELMELHAIGKPCCSPFTAADPHD